MPKFLNNTATYPEQEIILGTDERLRIADTTKPPFCWICSLEVQFPEPVINALGLLEQAGKNWQGLPTGTTGCGTGLLISPKHILTASHVVMGLKIATDSKSGEKMLQTVKASRVRVIPGRNDRDLQAKPFGIWTLKGIQVNPTFRQRLSGRLERITKNSILNALPFDVAILELQPKVQRQSQRQYHLGDKIGWWGKERLFHFSPLTRIRRNQLIGHRVQIGGFPGEKGRKPCSQLHLSEGDILTTLPKLKGRILDLILYNADTSAGMSGSPVWVKTSNGHRHLIGVHTSFSKYKNRKPLQKGNLAVLLTKQIVKQMQLNLPGE